jgi:hypothetical protein
MFTLTSAALTWSMTSRLTAPCGNIFSPLVLLVHRGFNLEPAVKIVLGRIDGDAHRQTERDYQKALKEIDKLWTTDHKRLQRGTPTTILIVWP